MTQINLDRVKEIRRQKGITQEDMAKYLGYKGKSGYCELENGNRRMTLIQARKIANKLNMRLEALFFNNSEKKAQ